MTVTVTNTGGHTTGILSVNIVAGDPYNFGVVATDCDFSDLAPGASCSATVLFSPQTAGAKFELLSVTDGAIYGAAGLWGTATP
jgi:hypothetical protein